MPLPSKPFVSYLAVGAIGFVIDASILAFLVHKMGWGDYSARLVSFPVAVFATWWLNRNYSFPSGATPQRGREYTRYIAVQTTGSLINFIVYSLCIATFAIMDQWPVLALIVGVLIQIPFNYFGMQKFVFTSRDKNTATS